MDKNKDYEESSYQNRGGRSSYKSWYRLDNAGKLYPSIVSTRRSTVFRISAKLKERVVPDLLQQALESAIGRFPYFRVHLKRGWFWYYFEETEDMPKVQKETYYPCMFLDFRKKGTFPFRVLYYGPYIHVEISHSVSDGTGALYLLKTLLVEYFKIKKNRVFMSLDPGIDVNEPVEKEESEDAFIRYYREHVPVPDALKASLQLPFRLMEKGKYGFITGHVSTKAILYLAKKDQATLTQWICAIYFLSIQEYMEKAYRRGNKKALGPIVINLPLDLRRLFPSKTRKNFFISLTPGIDLRVGHYSKKEILAYLKSYMVMNYDRKTVSRYISRNVRHERLLLVRVIPLVIKNRMMPYIYDKFGERGYTSSVSNLGKIELPNPIRDDVEGIEFYPPPSEGNSIKMCVCSYEDRCSISFGKTTEETEIERLFFTRLRRYGLHVKIETNLG